MKRSRLNGYVCELNVDYNVFGVLNPDKAIPFVHNYLMANYDIKWNAQICWKSVFYRINNFIRFYKSKFSIKLHFNEKHGCKLRPDIVNVNGN